MNAAEIFQYLKDNLSIQVKDESEPFTQLICGGEVEGSLAVKVTLFLKNEKGESVAISADSTYIGR